MKTPERSVEEFEQKFGLRFNNPDDVPLQGDVQDWLTQTLKAERQRCEEITSMPAFKHLQDYKQLDEDGVLVEVSRQAIDEIVQALTQPNKPK